YDDLRRYARSLAGVEPTAATVDDGGAARVRLRADVEGSLELAEQVLTIAREGVRNIRRHARATRARVEIGREAGRLRMTIEDDAVGLPPDGTPWAMASRVSAVGGRLEVGSAGRGSQVVITIPDGPA